MKTTGRTICISVAVCLVCAVYAYGAGVVPPDTTLLADSASSNNPAVWWLDGDYISPPGNTFAIGTWNQLFIDNGYSFTASDGLTVGRSNASNSLLHVQAGSNVSV